MILYVFVAIVTVLLGLLVNNHEVRDEGGITRGQMLNGLSLLSVFLILFALSSCRLNVGNDYAKYVEFMHLIRCDAYVPTEFGFNFIVKLLYGISGFENYLLVFAFFAFFTVLLFLAAIYRQADSFRFSFFLFMALGYYFQSFSTVRYYLALAIALFAIPYVLRKEWLKFIFLILIGATLHKSLLVVIPLYFLASVAWKKWQLVLAAVFCSTFFFLQDFYLKLVVFLYPTYEETEYLEGGTSYVNIVRCLCVLLLALLLYQKVVKDSRRNRFYFYCNLGAMVMYVCCSFLPVISRIGYYLTLPQIFYIPRLLRRLQEGGTARRRLTGRVFTVLTVLAAVLYFALFLGKLSRPELRILPYHTFLFTDMPKTLSQMSD